MQHHFDLGTCGTISSFDLQHEGQVSRWNKRWKQLLLSRWNSTMGGLLGELSNTLDLEEPRFFDDDSGENFDKHVTQDWITLKCNRLLHQTSHWFCISLYFSTCVISFFCSKRFFYVLVFVFSVLFLFWRCWPAEAPGRLHQCTSLNSGGKFITESPNSKYH